MADFREQLEAQRARNEDIARQREQREREEREREQREREERERRRREQQERRDARHSELVSELQALLEDLRTAFAGSVVVRGGWTESGEEYVVKVATSGIHPRRSLLVELDRDDDEVLARWSSDVGESIEMWRLLEFSPGMLRELLLTLVDQERWVDATRPPPFPSGG